MITIQFHFSAFCGAKEKMCCSPGLDKNQLYLLDENHCICLGTKSKQLYWNDRRTILYYATYQDGERYRWPVLYGNCRQWSGVWCHNTGLTQSLWDYLSVLGALSTPTTFHQFQNPISMSLVSTYLWNLLTLFTQHILCLPTWKYIKLKLLLDIYWNIPVTRHFRPGGAV